MGLVGGGRRRGGRHLPVPSTISTTDLAHEGANRMSLHPAGPAGLTKDLIDRTNRLAVAFLNDDYDEAMHHVEQLAAVAESRLTKPRREYDVLTIWRDETGAKRRTSVVVRAATRTLAADAAIVYVREGYSIPLTTPVLTNIEES